ncbi:hypothetical protein RhiirA4_475492 [Rhizophagus irregularis]|uniref:Uncharacterized protein n=1 Tax=Rhizophagus irregularis TaxID=588596 RepID=A0A2I1H7B0_9GLOM|nr:hypothetical protein RhiirA4_473755 [Rhizophagus irregularis]PKY55783.1 hypothetical protein RhiirA4_475492 [Rhizophagus irregularis]
MMEAIYKSAMEEDLGCGLEIKSQQELFSKNEKYKFKGPTKKLPPASSLSIKPSSHIGTSKEVVKEFTNLDKDFSKRLPLRPLISIKPKDDHESSDYSDETKESNKKKRKKKKASDSD